MAGSGSHQHYQQYYLAATFQRYCRPLLTVKEDCKGSTGKYRLLSNIKIRYIAKVKDTVETGEFGSCVGNPWEEYVIVHHTHTES